MIALPAAALPPGIPVTLTASESEWGSAHQLGYSVDVHGDTAVAGAWKDDEAATDAGAVYIFRWAGSDWVQEAKLTASDAAEGDEFGTSVSIDGDTVIVGAPMDDDTAGTDQGSAYVFTRIDSTWMERAKLIPTEARPDDYFGKSVSLDNGSIVVGAPASYGAAYVFVGADSNWSEQARLPAEIWGAYHFGRSVAIHGDTVIAGATGASGAAFQSGAAYIFKREGTTWSQEAKFSAADSVEGDSFGYSVSIYGNTALIASLRDEDLGHNSGSAYIFTREGSLWSERAKLLADDGETDDHFGVSVAIDGDTAFVGAYSDDYFHATQAGAAYVFQGSGADWAQQAKLTSDNRLSTTRFGFAVALDGDTAIAGAYLASRNGFDSGSAHIFSRIEGTWVVQDPVVVADDGAEGDHFGANVAIDGDTALIRGGRGVFVFVRDAFDWVQQAKLTDPDASVGFGRALAIDGHTAVIGDPIQNGTAGFRQGAAYVFVRDGTTWALEDKLTSSRPQQDGEFGSFVAVDGDTVMVGAAEDIADSLEVRGAVYVFNRTGLEWSAGTRLDTPALVGDSFMVVAMDGDTAVVGAPGHNVGSGSVYVYRLIDDTWTLEALVVAPDGMPFDLFGSVLAFNGDTLVVGVERRDSVSGFSGAAYVFARSGSTWGLQAKLTGSDAEPFGQFGASTAISGDTAIIGDPYDSGSAICAGAVYVFTRIGQVWTERLKLPAPEPKQEDYLGLVTALDGNTAVLGMPYTDGSAGADQGAAWFYSLLDERLPALVGNVSKDTVHTNLQDAVAAAAPGDSLIGSSQAFSEGGSIDFGMLALSVNATHNIRVPFASSFILGPGTVLSYPGGHDASFFGPLDMRPGSMLRSLNVGAATTISSDLTLSFATISADTTLSSAGRAIVDGAALVHGAFINEGTTTLHGGSLFVTGSLFDHGVIDDGPAASGTGYLRVEGDLVLGRCATLSFGSAGGLISTAGSFDAAIDENARYELAQAELRLDGAAPQTLELMSADIGNAPAGLNRTLPGNYPLGTLRIGPSGTTVNLVDNHDNDGKGQGACEAIYTAILIIESGATLNTNGCPVYYHTLLLTGIVDDPAMLIEIRPADPGDCEMDGAVNLADFANLPGCLTGPSGGLEDACECFDIDADDHVTIADFAVFQVEFTGDRN